MPQFTTSSDHRRSAVLRGARTVVVLVALTLVAALVPASGAGAGAGTAGGSRRDSSVCPLGPRLVPHCGGQVLTGAYVAPKAGESYSRAFARYETETGAPTQVVHFYYRGDRLFPNADEQKALRQGGVRRILYAAWKPDEGYTWRQVADGAADAMIRRQAEYLRQNWRERMFLTVHHEPENEVKDYPGSGYEARDYRAMFRHVEDVFAASGVTNVVWVMNYMGFERWALTDWFDDLYAGDAYVDWLAYDPYKTAGIGGQEGGFSSLVNQFYDGSDWRGFYRWARANHPGKPVMMGEWGVGERWDNPAWKPGLFRAIAKRLDRFPRLKALIYFDNDNADVAGNVSVDTTAASLAAFRGFLDSGKVATIG